MGSLTDAVQAEIDLRLEDAALRDRLLELKADSKADPKEYRQVKDDLAALRRKWRLVREAFAPDPGPGGAVVTPATFDAKIAIKEEAK